MRTELALPMLFAFGIGGAQPAPARYTQQVSEQRPETLQSVNVTSDGTPRAGMSTASPSAVKKLMDKAAANDPVAQTELALRYEMGWGVPIDVVASTTWLLKAVAQRHPNALAVMGVRYEQGLGVRRDLQEAVKYYREAADAGHARAMCYLGDMYFGGIGVPPNHVDAYRWHMAALAAGDERCDAHARASSKSLSLEVRVKIEREGRALARRRLR